VQDSEILQRDLNNNGILRLTLNDAGRRNALSQAMLADLSAVRI
jgi:enoyl-CoA hydratase/carnithine racemase